VQVAAIVITAVILLAGLLTGLMLAGRSRRANQQGIHGELVGDVLLSTSELEQHAKDVAARHRVVSDAGGVEIGFLGMRTASRVFDRVRGELSRAVRDGQSIPPAGEWLLDNFYVIRGVIREIDEGITAGHYQRLPKLSNGALKGYPRVYAIALEIISHTDGRIDENSVADFIGAYQSVSALTTGELWSVPVFLRVALIHSLKNVALQVECTLQQRQRVEKWVRRLVASADGEDEPRIPGRYERRLRNMDPAFAVEMLHRLRNQGTQAGPVLSWLDELLARQGTTADDMVHLAHKRESAWEVSAGNAISSLRVLSSAGWTDSVEKLSLVERTLRSDPAGVYPQMDFESRDLYRHEVEEIARCLHTSEVRVAREAVDCARQAEKVEAREGFETGTFPGENSGDSDRRDGTADPKPLREQHVGYYLIAGGRDCLLAKLGYRPGLWRRLLGAIKRRPTALYLGGIGVATVAALSALVAYAGLSTGRLSPGLVLMITVVGFIPAGELAVGLVNAVVTRVVNPRILPKLELRDGIREDQRTMVVIPALLPGVESAQRLLEKMEVYYLANQQDNIHFALLGDFADAGRPHLPADDDIIRAATSQVQKLNERYSHDGDPVFYFFYRERRWNPAQDCWMGWERKRGKLEEFNRLLRSAGGDRTDTTYVLDEVPEILQKIRYVITLDADTSLPRDAARRLVGAISHPLNRAVIDPGTGRVIDGYGVLQPRVGISITSARRTIFSRIFSGRAGVDPYSTAVSDVYQDLFGEGIFTGKGIYDVDVFHRVLDQRFADNAVLSHDLLEGLYVRAGLATDIELIDGYPAKYNSYSKRLHRWVRGDWQLLPWLLPVVRNGRGEMEPNPLPVIGKWKIIDNLRRSLVAPALLIFITGALTFLPGSALFWFAAALVIMVFPLCSHLVNGMLSRPVGVSITGRFLSCFADGSNLLWQSLLSLVFLPHQAYLMVDAAARTLKRLITKKRLLEWMTAADAEHRLDDGFKGFCTAMWPGLAITAVFALLLVLVRRNIILGLPLILLWVTSPFVASVISRPLQRRQVELTVEQRSDLRMLARRTWAYFEDFVTPADSWLPPDNYQEYPRVELMHRTSPTNIGLLIMSTIAARDMGYISTRELLLRLKGTFSTLEKLERWHGHFYNWYDTQTLAPMKPLYVSTVDSGNLAGYLMTLAQVTRELLKQPVVDWEKVVQGLQDTLALAGQMTQKSYFSREDLNHISELVLNLNGTVDAETVWVDRLAGLNELEQTMAPLADHRAEAGGTSGTGEYLMWMNRLLKMVRSWRSEIETLMPWVIYLDDLPGEIPAVFSGDGNGSAAAGYRVIVSKLARAHTPAEVVRVYPQVIEELEKLERAWDGVYEDGPGSGEDPERQKALEWIRSLRDSLLNSLGFARQVVEGLKALGDTAEVMVGETDFTKLYDARRDLFSIGFNIEENRLTRAHYDLLASEARQASLVAIAKGDVPRKHWFRMGRMLTRAGGGRALLSWSGTMFEYLMPLLIMRDYEGTLLHETYAAVVKEQIRYAKRRRVPWGISESAFNAFNLQMNYQYQASGVPTLGLRRSLGCDLTVAPYATVLAVMVDPASAWKNLKVLAACGLAGRYGLYEAIDYTRERLPRGKTSAVVRTFMVHHLGMSLVAIDNCLNAGIMRERFHRDPRIQATDLLLQERASQAALIIEVNTYEDYGDSRFGRKRRPGRAVRRTFGLDDVDGYDVCLLSNGSYSLMINTAGAGYSRWKGRMVSRWREDSTKDDRGIFFYIKDLHAGTVWSATYQPSLVKPDEYRVEFAEDTAEFERRDGDIITTTKISISPENNVEVRRISITNRGNTPRLLEVTSFFEAVIAPQAADMAHPAFSNLFVQTEFVPSSNSLLVTRRPRGEERQIWLVHTLGVAGETVGDIEYETDRWSFTGRNRDVHLPAALDGQGKLSGTVGSVLDPCVSLRRRVRVSPGKTVRLVFSTGVAESRDDALVLSEIYHDPDSAGRTFALARTRSQVQLRYLNLNLEEAYRFHTMASRLVYHRPQQVGFEPGMAVPESGYRSALWAHGISADLPVVLVQVNDLDDAQTVREALMAHEYWRLKGLEVDMVILNEQSGAYTKTVQDMLRQLVTSCHAQPKENRPGGVFLKQASLLTREDIVLLKSTARLVIGREAGSLAAQASSRAVDYRPAPVPAELRPVSKPVQYAASTQRTGMVKQQLQVFNGLGGFTETGDEYVIILEAGKYTPAPWINVIANGDFGFQVSETGSGYTWAANSRENKLTPWSNDPVTDPPGEAVYLRDDKTGEVWSPTALPIREEEPYIIRHGQGYSIFEHDSHGIYQELEQFVPAREPVKVLRLRLRNSSGIHRSLSVTYYIEPVLGVFRETSYPHIKTEFDAVSGSILVQNHYREGFAHHITFAATSTAEFTFTCDREEFLGRNGTYASPAALRRTCLSGRFGSGLDPCIAIMASVDLDAGEEREVVFVLGECSSRSEARALAARIKTPAVAASESEGTRSWWDNTLQAIVISTPDRSLDLIVNRWLVYQVLGCRVWARSAFYQSGGAYGFRDQLQDVMALLYSRPWIARRHILRSAARQFVEGDVQHWWHPETGKGIRTKFSDDLLWLPFVTARYVEITGDTEILDEEAGFLEDQPLAHDEVERYSQPWLSTQTGTVYEHCLRAIDRALRFGEHGLPLMGSGDWNDGMNKVGWQGSGESVWLAWFLYVVLTRFAAIARMRGDQEHVSRYLHAADRLAAAIEESAWDGDWYRRAYFDDGTPLGTSKNEQCRIDSISQSWAVISGAGDPARAVKAMRAVEDYLVREDDGLILLLTPPFDKTALDPGYIKGYVPGVRENGGQYTHAAMWVILATAMLGHGDRAMELMDLINPVNHTKDPGGVQRYRVEPYVVAADVNAVGASAGRGGWTWYTGAAGWMYQVVVEGILGFKKRGDHLALDPHVPANWPGFEITYRYRGTLYRIAVEKPEGMTSRVVSVSVDGRIQEDGLVRLVDDGGVHRIVVTLGAD